MVSGNYKVNCDKLKHLNLREQVLMYITDPFGRRKPTAARHLRELGDYDSRVHSLPARWFSSLRAKSLSEEQTKETEEVVAKYYFFRMFSKLHMSVL